LKAVAPFDTVASPFVVVAAVVELVVVAVELVVEPPGAVVVVVPGSVGRVGTVTVTGRETVGTVVVTQPTTTGRQSCGAAGALLVNAPATKRPAMRIPAPAATRAAVASLL